jgi:hypothetical protein
MQLKLHGCSSLNLRSAHNLFVALMFECAWVTFAPVVKTLPRLHPQLALLKKRANRRLGGVCYIGKVSPNGLCCRAI